MHRVTKIFMAVFFATILGGGPTSRAAEETSTTKPSSEAEQERSALRVLAAGLSAGGEGLRALRGPVVIDDEKDRLEPGIPAMDCEIDLIANYVSCYSTTINTKEEAEHRFKGLIKELQALLPANRWHRSENQPGVDSISSYGFDDVISDASIDIDLVARLRSAAGDLSYIVRIFGWAAPEPRL
jgi:hypothetical protein